MTEENEPNVEDLKAQERVEIPVDDMDEEVEKERPRMSQEEISQALSDLGRQVGETMKTIWDSEERRNFERDVREGVRRFGDEINNVLQEAKRAAPSERMRERAGEARARVDPSEFSRMARGGLVQGLQWLSQELNRLADQFSPATAQPEEEELARDEPPVEETDIPDEGEVRHM